MMMNKILWDLINTEEVESFIDDVIVRTGAWQNSRKDNKKVSRKWSIYETGEVRFLGIVIGLEDIKIEKEKIKSIGLANSKKGQA